jgi:hypothetical protein
MYNNTKNIIKDKTLGDIYMGTVIGALMSAFRVTLKRAVK